jgi:hypothetical protein
MVEANFLEKSILTFPWKLAFFPGKKTAAYFADVAMYS